MWLLLDLIKDKNTGWGVNPRDESQLTNIFQQIDKTGEKEFLQKQINCLKIINDYSLEKFSSSKGVCLFFNKKK